MKKWLRILGITISYPSSVLLTAYAFHILIEKKAISPLLGWGIFIFFVLSFVVLLIIEAFNAKK